MPFDKFSFSSIQIDGSTYEHDVIIDRGEVRKRKKNASKKFREQFVETPLSIDEEIPWQCHQLRHRQWSIRPIARPAGRTARGRESQSQIACSTHDHNPNKVKLARNSRSVVAQKPSVWGR